MSAVFRVHIRPWLLAGRELFPGGHMFGSNQPRRTQLAIVGIGVATVLVGTTGSAYAYLTASGSGTGSATTASGRSTSETNNVVTQAATTGTLLRPGLTGDLAVSVKNNNTFPINVSSLAASAAGVTGCTTPALTVNPPTSYKVGGSTVTLPQTVAAGSTTTFTLVGGVTMGASSSDCQSKTLTLPVTINWTG